MWHLSQSQCLELAIEAKVRRNLNKNVYLSFSLSLSLNIRETLNQEISCLEYSHVRFGGSKEKKNKKKNSSRQLLALYRLLLTI